MNFLVQVVRDIRKSCHSYWISFMSDKVAHSQLIHYKQILVYPGPCHVFFKESNIKVKICQSSDYTADSVYTAGLIVLSFCYPIFYTLWHQNNWNTRNTSHPLFSGNYPWHVSGALCCRHAK